MRMFWQLLFSAPPRKQLLPLKNGDLFHTFNRSPNSKHDKLSEVLSRGLIAPGSDSENRVVRNCSEIIVTGASYDYEKIVFLYQVQPTFQVCLFSDTNSVVVLLDPSLEVIQQHEMEEPWVPLSSDEVYVKDKVPVEYFRGLIVHSSKVDSVIEQFEARLRELKMKVYDNTTKLRWSP